MSQYLILIYEDESAYANANPDVFNEEVMEAHNTFAEKNGSAMPVATRSSRPRRPRASAHGTGGSTVTDGPFAETKEALGGYYLIEAADLDEAIGIAKRCPAASAASKSADMVFD